MIRWSIPNNVAANLQAFVGVGRRRDIGASRWCSRAVHSKMLIGTLKAGRVVDDVVKDRDVAIGDRLDHANARRSPASCSKECAALCGVAIAGTLAVYHLDHVAPRAHPVERVVGHDNVVATVHAEARSLRVVDDVVDDFDVVRLVMQPGRRHKLKSGALPGSEAASAGIVNFIALDAEGGRATLGIHCPIPGAMDLAANNVAVLNAHEIDCVVPGPGNVAVFDIEILRLIHLQGFLRSVVCRQISKPYDGGVAKQDVV